MCSCVALFTALVVSVHAQLMSADRSAEYALAEVDILTSRISELTTENQSIEAAKIEFTEQLKVANISAGNYSI